MDHQKKNAMKRLARDLQELDSDPVCGISAQPLEDNLFEWHCNMHFHDSLWHVVLFFPDNYPYVSPSAEFMPPGFAYFGGASMAGKKGVRICLSLFSDYAHMHREWEGEKMSGWTASYSVKAALLNLQAHILESMGEEPEQRHWYNANKKLTDEFKCADCGHSKESPQPAIEMSDATKSPSPCSASKSEIIDYVTKEEYAEDMDGEDDVFGYGIIRALTADARDYLWTPCEFIKYGTFHAMKNSVGKVYSSMKDELTYFLPLCINSQHSKRIKPAFEKAMEEFRAVIPEMRAARVEEMIVRVFPYLLSLFPIELQAENLNETLMQGFHQLHCLFLWAAEEYPSVKQDINNRIKNFLEDSESRTIKKVHAMDEWLFLLTASDEYKWQHVANAYITELWRRNVADIVDVNPELLLLDTDADDKVKKLWEVTLSSNQLLAYQVMLLRHALPGSFEEKVAEYDNRNSIPTTEDWAKVKDGAAKVTKLVSYQEWMQFLDLGIMTTEEIAIRYVDSVEFAINTKDYHRHTNKWKEVQNHFEQRKNDETLHIQNLPSFSKEAHYDERSNVESSSVILKRRREDEEERKAKRIKIGGGEMKKRRRRRKRRW